MFGTFIYGPGDVRYEERETPSLTGTKDAVVRTVAACVCGSDLWGYRGLRGEPGQTPIGHEFVGIVESVGSDVTTVAVGDFVIAPFYGCDGTCINCRNGFSSSCLNRNWWDGAQSEYVHVPLADGTLVVVPDVDPDDDALVASLLTLSDVMCTGYHAAVSAGVGAGSTVVVVGDGAVGLSAVLASKVLGASRIVAMSRHEDRQKVALSFGATDIVEERGDEGVAAVREMFDGIGPDAALECVGSKASMDQALRSARPGGMVGFVGVPVGGPELPVGDMFASNVGVRGGMAPVRSYIEPLLKLVLSGEINPGAVFTRVRPLSEVAEAYADMDERREIKVMLTTRPIDG